VTPNEITQCLVKVAHCWLDRQFPLRQQAILTAAPEFCLSKASFELALDWIFEQWTAERISTSFAQNPYKDKQYAVQILAGNTPAMIAQGFLQACILNIPQCLKIPGNQSLFAQLLYQSFAENGITLTDLMDLHIGKDNLPLFYFKLTKADLVLAYGRDETIDVLRNYISPEATFIAHGHAESAAIIFKEAVEINNLEKLAYDMLSYDQRGCLSPRVVYIEEGGKYTPAEYAKIFAELILPSFAKQLPRGGLFPGEAEEILHQRSLGRFRGSVYTGNDWTICYDDEQTWPVTALPRFIFFKSFKNPQALITILHPIKNHLISFGFAGAETKRDALLQTLPIRCSELGNMQKQLLIF
jgi:hypothetical protein